MSLDFGVTLTAHKEVTSHHRQIAVPSLQILDGCVLFRRESECKYGVGDAGFVAYTKQVLLDVLLMIKNADDETLEDFECLGRMMVRRDAMALHERVAAVEEFAYVAAIVLLDREFSSWMHLLKATGVQDEVIENEQRNACSNSLVNLLGRVDHEATVGGTMVVRCNYDHV